MAHNILIAGSGKIGALIACLLAEAGDYNVHMADITFDNSDVSRLTKKFDSIKTEVLNVKDASALDNCIDKFAIEAVLSCLPYHCNVPVAEAAARHDIHYFDLTEDISVTKAVKQLSENGKSAFVPQCGLAPGFITIAANSLMQSFDKVDEVKMRVGALPQNASNVLQYALTWSTDGLINEYGNPCHAIDNGEDVLLHPLEGLERIELDGELYEAFNTSGGLGSLPELYAGKVRRMNYKTMRYPGHCEKIRFLMNDLRLNDDRDTLKIIFERAMPKTYQDVVLIYVSVTGQSHGDYLERNYVKKVYPARIADLDWSAIQVTTAAGITSVLDLVLAKPDSYQGLVYQEKFSLQDVLANRFGQYYA